MQSDVENGWPAIQLKHNPDKPVVAKRESRFIGKLTIEYSIENIQSFETDANKY